MKITKFNLIWLSSFILVFILSGCDSYRVSVYPDKNNLYQDISLNGFSSLEYCRAAAKKLIEEMNLTNADYECGKNCREISDPLGDYAICKTSER
tara:strand:- start:441 stop:725 length:285 start_codon:yes stop_codon:yes gene_type:complete